MKNRPSRCVSIPVFESQSKGDKSRCRHSTLFPPAVAQVLVTDQKSSVHGQSKPEPAQFGLGRLGHPRVAPESTGQFLCSLQPDARVHEATWKQTGTGGEGQTLPVAQRRRLDMWDFTTQTAWDKSQSGHEVRQALNSHNPERAGFVFTCELNAAVSPKLGSARGNGHS